MVMKTKSSKKSNQLILYNKKVAKWLKFLGFIITILSITVFLFFPFGTHEFKSGSNLFAFLSFIAIIAANLLYFFIPAPTMELYPQFALYAFAAGFSFYIIHHLWFTKHKLAVCSYLVVYFSMVVFTIVSASLEKEFYWLSIIGFFTSGVPLLLLIRIWFIKKIKKM